jgi:hypothetical protein
MFNIVFDSLQNEPDLTTEEEMTVIIVLYRNIRLRQLQPVSDQ